jgi:Ni/Co efflux regulator RcnB
MTRILTLTIAAAVVAATATAADAGAAGRIGRREWRQQGRIAQGVASGQLTPRETVRLERRQIGLNREIGTMRRWNGGALTPGERALVNRQQNALSRGIYRFKHNGAVRHR